VDDVCRGGQRDDRVDDDDDDDDGLAVAGISVMECVYRL
jgi:hypothetical protein